jgi:L,D-transpeptidase catalytic domain
LPNEAKVPMDERELPRLRAMIRFMVPVFLFAGAAHADGAPRKAATELALRALAPHVTRMSHPQALRIAFDAYYSYRSANPEQVRKPYLYYVDLGLDNRTPRGYVFDMESMTLVEGPFPVAHGRGSARGKDGVPTRFSNRAGSYASSLGLYLAQETYTFRGKSGGHAYRSVGLRMRGESGEFNSAARPRGIVAHGAPYVTSGRAGRSEGCPAMETRRANRLLPLVADGGVVFIFSPHDPHWLRDDPWIAAP